MTTDPNHTYGDLRAKDAAFGKHRVWTPNKDQPAGKWRAFCFTAFDMRWDIRECLEWKNVKYLTIGFEHCKNGRPHYQGAVYFVNARACGGFMKALPAGTNFRVARGSEASNEAYTQKESTVLTIGVPSRQGERTDLESIRIRIINEGATPADLVCEQGVDFKKLQFAEAVFRLAGNAPKRAWKTSVVWLWGGAGKGKSTVARSLMRNIDACDIWTSSAKLDYWQQYNGQDTVWFDEFRGDKCTFTNLLQILDSTPFECNVKYGSQQLLAKRIVITSSMHPKDAYSGCAENVNQLLRRIEVIWNIDELYAACADKYVFPEVPFFDDFGTSVNLCAESKLTAKNPIRYEGRVCFELVSDEWVPCVEQKVLGSCVPALGVMGVDSAQAQAPLTQPAVPAQKWGGNTGPDSGTTALHASTTGPPPTSSDIKCSVEHVPTEYCEDCCPHEATADDGLTEDGSEICLYCGAYVIEETEVSSTCLCGFPEAECEIVCADEPCQCWLEKPIDEDDAE